jgi:uncharacterized protein (TIGR00369 family)
MDTWEQILAFEPFLRFVGLAAKTLGPEEVVLHLPVRNEIANHLGALHGGAQFTLGETTGLTTAVLSLGERLDRVAVLTRNATITYQRPSQGDLFGRARVQLEERAQLQAAWSSQGKARLTVPVEIVDTSGQVVTVLNVACLVLPLPRPASQGE